MLILGVDTSGRQGSLALARGGADRFEVLDQAQLAGGSYSARLIPELTAMLLRQALSKRDIEGFAVVSGPGSFTGLRVGLSAVKALAEVLKRPIAAISMLAAVAAASNTDGRTIAALDAGRKELYVGEYEVSGTEAVARRELLLTQMEFAALLEADADAELVTPDIGVAELAGMHLKVRQIEWPSAGEIARLGFRRMRRGETVPPETLEANYIRRSDAEIFAPKKS